VKEKKNAKVVMPGAITEEDTTPDKERKERFREIENKIIRQISKSPINKNTVQDLPATPLRNSEKATR
jgi:ribosome maturation protein Sdo1